MVAAVAVAAAFSCRPAPGLGSVAYTRAAKRHVVDLSTCTDRVVGSWRALSPSTPGVTVRATGRGRRAKQTIWSNGRPIFTEREYKPASTGMEAPGPIWLLRLSADRRWLFFAIDPYGSNSVAQDGLVLRVISLRGGVVHTLGTMLPYADHVAWCGGNAVLSAGSDRIAWHHKRLLVASPPDWRVRALVPNRGRAWGSLVCAPDDKSVIVQSQRASDVARFRAGRWALWQIDLDRSERQLTHPPRDAADESPTFKGRTLFFVRTTRLHGAVYALRRSRLLGPFAWLGYSSGWYGHQAWPYTPR